MWHKLELQTKSINYSTDDEVKMIHNKLNELNVARTRD